ncbi:hypothetical protein Q3G72_011392 [Acer saccharum]|nr:hypothetical protein Q3G72_011392 [Acer saccharum]
MVLGMMQLGVIKTPRRILAIEEDHVPNIPGKPTVRLSRRVDLLECNDKEAMQIAQKVDAIEIVPNHEIMAQEQASNLSKNILEEETHGNHSEGLVAAMVEPSFQILTIHVTIDHEEEIEEFQILNHVINASDQFGNNSIINVGNMVNNSTINPEKDFVSNQVNDSTTQKSASNQVNDSTSQKSVGNQVIDHLPYRPKL